MRDFSYTITAEDNLADLDALDDLDMIDKAVKELAADEKTGYPVNFQSESLKREELLLQYEVGRYKLNYTLTQDELIVRSVMV